MAFEEENWTSKSLKALVPAFTFQKKTKKTTFYQPNSVAWCLIFYFFFTDSKLLLSPSLGIIYLFFIISTFCSLQKCKYPLKNFFFAHFVNIGRFYFLQVFFLQRLVQYIIKKNIHRSKLNNSICWGQALDQQKS